MPGCRRHEPAAQRALHALLAPRLLGICRRYARTRAEADDLLQDTFLKLFSRLDQFRADGPFVGWAKRLCVRTCLDAYRTTLRAGFATVNLEEATDLPAPDADALAALSAQELVLLIGRLPDGYRVVLNLYCIEGYAHQEIAAQLGIDERTSSSQLFKARRLLAALVRHAETPRRPTRQAV